MIDRETLVLNEKLRVVHTDKEIAKSLINEGVIDISSGKLEWGKKVGVSQSTFTGNMHHPIFQKLQKIYITGAM